MKLEITPQPSEEERAAIETALGQDVRKERSSAWAELLLPKREDELGSGPGRWPGRSGSTGP
jgi:hypothetical protein